MWRIKRERHDAQPAKDAMKREEQSHAELMVMVHKSAWLSQQLLTLAKSDALKKGDKQ